MKYICVIPIVLIFAIIYIVSKQWELKLFAKISKIIIVLCIIFFVITYASYLGYNIPVITNFCNNLIK